MLAREVLEHPLATEPVEAGLLLPTEGHVYVVMNRRVVDMGHPGLDSTFIDGYRICALICTGLLALGGILAWALVSSSG